MGMRVYICMYQSFNIAQIFRGRMEKKYENVGIKVLEVVQAPCGGVQVGVKHELVYLPTDGVTSRCGRRTRLMRPRDARGTLRAQPLSR